MYSSLMEAMIDKKYQGLRGEDLVNAYTVDILEVEQRLGSVREENCSILQEGLQLLRRTAAEASSARVSN